MAPIFDDLLRLGQIIQWKHILLFSICLLTIHVLLKDDASAVGRPPAVVKPVQRPQDDSAPIYDLEDVPLAESPLGRKPDTSDSDSKPYDALPGDEHVAICIAVKDQSADLVEFFVHHYHHMGIKRFYVMDDGSEPHLSKFEYPGIPRTALTFVYQPRSSRNNYQQLVFYTQCIERYRDRHTWIAFLDGDEFLETPGEESLTEVLRSFEGNETVGALGINWRMHTSNGLLKRPESTRKSFTECIFDDEENGGDGTDNNHIKTIIKTAYAGPPVNPHKFQTAPGTHTVGEYGDIIESAAWRKPITRNRISLHHYAVKSKAEYDEKVNRGNGMTDPKGEAFWKHVEEEIEHVACPEMARYDP